MMSRLMDVVLLSSFLLILLTAVVQGYLKPLPAGVVFVGMFGLLVVSRIRGASLVDTAMRLGFAALALWMFVVTTGGGDWRSLGSILAPLLVLLVVLYGLYTMVMGGFGKKKRGK